MNMCLSNLSRDDLFRLVVGLLRTRKGHAVCVPQRFLLVDGDHDMVTLESNVLDETVMVSLERR